MKPEEKKLILILVIITVVVGVIAFFVMRGNNNKNNNGTQQAKQENVTEEYVQKLEDGSKLKVSEELRKTKTLDGLEFTNIQLKEIGGITTLLADVENKTSSATNEKVVSVKILDKSGNTITELKGIIDSIQPSAKAQLNIAVTADVANAYNFEISNAK